MPSALCRLCPCPCPCPGRWPRGFGGRRPRRLLLRPPPPEGLPGPAFIVLSKFLLPDFDSYQFLPDSNCALGESSCPASATALRTVARRPLAKPCALRSADAQVPGAHLGTISHSRNHSLLCKPNRSICVSNFRFRICRAASRRAGVEGLRGNEAK